jgi:hypothetical protein
MCAKDAENSKCASNGGESAQPTSPPTTSESVKPCRLRCNPQNLPEPKAPKAKVPKIGELSAEEHIKLKDYFFDQKAKSIKRARERRWI